MNLKEKLSELIFLEVKTEELEKLLKIDIKWNEKSLFMPIKSQYISSNLNDEAKIDNIPISEFIFGMALTIGCDRDFRFNTVYIDIIKKIPDAINYIKGSVAESVKNNELVNAYAVVRGLIAVEPCEDNFEKTFIIVEALRQKNKSYKDDELELIDRAKGLINGPIPYFYESLIYKDDEEYDKALIALDTYFEKGGKREDAIVEFEEWLQNSKNYSEAKEILYDNPERALELLLPLLDDNMDNPLMFYYIAVAYRLLENYQKAIYYLNESVNLDDNILEVANELGLNYASIGDYKKALVYFERAFKVTGNIEFCTNIIMCYLKLNNTKKAEEYLKQGEKIKKDDEVLNELKKYF